MCKKVDEKVAHQDESNTEPDVFEVAEHHSSNNDDKSKNCEYSHERPNAGVKPTRNAQIGK